MTLTSGTYPPYKPPRIQARYIPKRTDKNHGAVIRLFRQLGWAVKSLHETGGGVFDSIIAKHGLNILVEIKNGKKSPSGRKLTPAQKQFNFEWTGMRAIAICDADVFSINDQANDILRAIHNLGLKLEVIGNTEKQYQPGLFA